MGSSRLSLDKLPSLEGYTPEIIHSYVFDYYFSHMHDKTIL
jgi:hypothetical protein